MTSALQPSAIKRILVIKLRAIGDVLLSTVVLDNLRSAFPNAAIHFLTEPPAAGLLKTSPFDRSDSGVRPQGDEWSSTYRRSPPAALRPRP